MPMFRKKPVVVVEARQLLPGNVALLQAWITKLGGVSREAIGGTEGAGLCVNGVGADECTPMQLRVNLNDYVIYGQDGKFRATRPDIFEQLYEPAPELQPSSITVVATPESSNVSGWRYDASTHTLQVSFKNGGTYNYLCVDASLVTRLQAAKSVGSFLNKEVKPKHTCERIG